MDWKDKTIAWLAAELRAAIGRCRHGGMTADRDREVDPVGCRLEASGQICHCQVAAGILRQHVSATREANKGEQP